MVVAVDLFNEIEKRFEGRIQVYITPKLRQQLMKDLLTSELEVLKEVKDK